MFFSFQDKGGPDMKKMIFMAVIVMVGVACSEVLAQEVTTWKDGWGWGPTTYYARIYNRHALESVSGEVVSVERITPVEGMSCGITIMVETDKETIPIHLGPAWYVDNQDVKIVPGDRVDVKGSRVTLEGKPALMAANMKRGNEALTLREVDGFPLWSNLIDWSDRHWGE
jgi:hypothetical protein